MKGHEVRCARFSISGQARRFRTISWSFGFSALPVKMNAPKSALSNAFLRFIFLSWLIRHQSSRPLRKAKIFSSGSAGLRSPTHSGNLECSVTDPVPTAPPEDKRSQRRADSETLRPETSRGKSDCASGGNGHGACVTVSVTTGQVGHPQSRKGPALRCCGATSCRGVQRMGFEPTTSCVQGGKLAPASASEHGFMQVFEGGALTSASQRRWVLSPPMTPRTCAAHPSGPVMRLSRKSPPLPHS